MASNQCVGLVCDSDHDKQSIDQIASDSSLAQLVAPNIIDAICEWAVKSNSIRILTSGKAGTGKSTLINGIVGSSVAKEGGGLNPETLQVTMHRFEVGDVMVEIYDSPGLQDQSQNEARYIAEIQHKCSNVDLFIYCIRMSETRFFPGCPDAVAMKQLTQALGQKLWENGIIVLTFANEAVSMIKAKCSTDVSKDFRVMFEKITKKVKMFLTTDVGLPVAIVENVTIVHAGHKNTPLLPKVEYVDVDIHSDQVHWLSYLWLKALHKTRLDAQPALIKLNIHRLNSDKDYLDGEAISVVEEIADMQPLMLAQKGSEIGKELGESGRRIGNAIGKCFGSFQGADLGFYLLLKLSIERDWI